MSWICARQDVITATQRSNAQRWETLAATDLNALGWCRTMPLMEAFASLRTQRPHSPRLLQQVVSLTQTLIHVSCEESTPIPRKVVFNLVQSVVRGRCATTTPCQMARRHVVHSTQQQQRVHVCRAQRLTNASLLVPLIAHMSQTAFNWELKVATTLRAVGSMVIANLHLSYSWCEVLASFLLSVAKSNEAEAQGMLSAFVRFCAGVAEFGKLCVSTCMAMRPFEPGAF